MTKEINVADLDARLRSGEEIFILDVREPHEAEISSIDGFPRGGFIRLGQKAHILLPVLQDVVLVLPETDGQAGEVGGSEGGGLDAFRPDDRRAEEIRLKLQQRFAARGPAIDPQFLERQAAVLLHGLDEVGGLKGN